MVQTERLERRRTKSDDCHYPASKLPMEPQGSRPHGIGKAEGVHVWEQNAEPRNSQPGLLMRNTSAISTEEPFYNTPVFLKAVKVLKPREFGETAQAGGALGDKKTKCNVWS